MNRSFEDDLCEELENTTALTGYDAYDDGWDDAAADYAANVLKGERLKFNEGFWTVGKEARSLANGTQLVALSTRHGWVWLKKGEKARYQWRQKGKALPDRWTELDDQDKTKWPIGLSGCAEDPWKETRVVYFVDPATAEAFTYDPKKTYFGLKAVEALGDQIARMRKARPAVSPVVEFHTVKKPTNFGPKMTPVLKVVAWVGGHNGNPDSNPAMVQPPPQPSSPARQIIAAKSSNSTLPQEEAPPWDQLGDPGYSHAFDDPPF
jgi:hypothetical protein